MTSYIVRIVEAEGLVDYVKCPSREDADKYASRLRKMGITVQVQEEVKNEERRV